jgi:hypothetical protein
MAHSRVADKPVETLVGSYGEKADGARGGVRPIATVIHPSTGSRPRPASASCAHPLWSCRRASNTSAQARADPQILVGRLLSGVGAYLSVRFLTRWFETRSMRPFAIYCIVAGLGCLTWFSLR